MSIVKWYCPKLEDTVKGRRMKQKWYLTVDKDDELTNYKANTVQS